MASLSDVLVKIITGARIPLNCRMSALCPIVLRPGQAGTHILHLDLECTVRSEKVELVPFTSPSRRVAIHLGEGVFDPISLRDESWTEIDASAVHKALDHILREIGLREALGTQLNGLAGLHEFAHEEIAVVRSLSSQHK